MEPFTTFRSRVAPLPLKDVNTDMILPARFLTSTSREGYGKNLFRDIRDRNPNFVLNRSDFQNTRILAVGANFGCGSSREHAVWAILGAGIKAVIGKSFADIFFSNSAKNGLLLVTLPGDLVDRILREARSGIYSIEVDLGNQCVTLPAGEQHPFDYDPFRKHCLLDGLDDIDYIASHKKEIVAFRAARDTKRFFSTLSVRQ